VPNKNRCKLHGGASTGPKGGHGIYSTTYGKEEQSILKEARQASLDEELALARITLRRLLIAAPPPVGQGKLTQGGPDWWTMLDRFMGRVGRLAEQHAKVEEVKEIERRLDELTEKLENDQ